MSSLWAENGSRTVGRLSAGLAHELNNPAAAVRRLAAGLAEELTGLTDLVSDLMRHDVDESHISAMNRLRRLASERSVDELSPLARAQREESVATWLEEHAVAKAWDVAGTFADASLTVDDLEVFAGTVPKALHADVLVARSAREPMGPGGASTGPNEASILSWDVEGAEEPSLWRQESRVSPR